LRVVQRGKAALLARGSGRQVLLSRPKLVDERGMTVQEHSLRTNEQLFRIILGNLPGVIVSVVDEDLRVRLVEGEPVRATGLDPAELIGTSILDSFAPEDVPGIRGHYNAALDGVEGRYEFTSLVSGRDYEVHLVPLSDEDAVHSVVGLALDVTERKRLEAERLDDERRLQETQKLESLGVLAGGIAHEFNNLLVGILGYASLAAEVVGDDPNVRDMLAQIELAAQQAGELTQQMLAYSGKGRFVVEPVNLSETVEAMSRLVGTAIPKEVVLTYRFEVDLPSVESDVSQMRQVILSLVTNAAEAIGDERGEIVVSTGSVQADAAYLAEFALSDGLPGGEYVFLEVADTGAGMDAETQARLFEPFYTSKFTGRGLGLAAVLGIVRGHKGALRVRSELGRGSTFTLLFPTPAAAPRR
jgi:two-component system, cell cycle sensor histidine kinase and response regulator CckA